MRKVKNKIDEVKVNTTPSPQSEADFNKEYIKQLIETERAYAYSIPNLNKILSESQKNIIKIPADFKSKVIATKDILKNDSSGIVDSTLDFMVNCSATDYNIYSKNEKSKNILTDWSKLINNTLRGKIPVGLTNLSKEYYRELWKASSNIVLRTIWNYVEIQGITLKMPTVMWFVDGKDITVEADQNTQILGDEKYYLSTSKDSKIALPTSSSEKIYVQRPYEQWGEFYPTPFIIKRGIYKNLAFYNLLLNKIEVIVQSALEYILLVKKGTEQMYLNNLRYTPDQLKQLGAEFSQLYKSYDNVRSNASLPILTNTFDTDIQHLMPEYKKILEPIIFTALNSRILHAFGLVEHIRNIDGTVGRENQFNPKPFIREIKSGINGFVSLINDVIYDIIEENKISNPKLFSVKNDIKLKSPIVVDFISEKTLNYVRSLWDRGLLANQEFLESTTEYDYESQVDARKNEKANKEEAVMYPRKIQNLDNKPISNPNKNSDKTIPDDKVNPIEKQNYSFAKYDKISDLPDNLDILPSEAKTVWKNIFNDNMDKGEDVARKIAWTGVKNGFKKNKNGDWVKK